MAGCGPYGLGPFGGGGYFGGAFPRMGMLQAYGALGGRTAGMTLPPGRTPVPMPPGSPQGCPPCPPGGPGYPPGYPPGGPGYPPGPPPWCLPPDCYPCPPPPEVAAMLAAADQAACLQNAYEVRKAATAAVKSAQPQAPLGVGTAFGVTLAPNVATPFPAQSSVPICLNRFEIPRDLAPFFVIESIRLARQELLADGVGIPADAFSSDAIQTPLLEFPQLWPGAQIIVTVRNMDAAPHPFRGTWWGVPAEMPRSCLENGPLFS